MSDGAVVAGRSDATDAAGVSEGDVAKEVSEEAVGAGVPSGCTKEEFWCRVDEEDVPGWTPVKSSLLFCASARPRHSSRAK